VGEASRRKAWADAVFEQVKKIAEACSDHCSICRAEHPHNSRTYGGIDRDGNPALVGDCCVDKMQTLVSGGIYTSRSYGPLYPFSRTKSGEEVEPRTLEEMEKGIAALQEYFRKTDEDLGSLSRKAGMPGRPLPVLSDGPWKKDDAAWFNAHPNRSHRIRTPYPGEFKGKKFPPFDPPPTHEFQVLVRQVEPGQRVKLVFCRNMEVELPDVEAILHAIFDIEASSSDGDKGRPISVREVAEIAMRYARGADA
jgi:hypothetical protein